MSLVSPFTSLNILKNISLHLPEGYELITGIKLKDIYSYYDTIQTAIIGGPYHIKIILNVPLKTTYRYFVLYKIFFFLISATTRVESWLSLQLHIPPGTPCIYIFLISATTHVESWLSLQLHIPPGTPCIYIFLISATTRVESWLSLQFSSIQGGLGLVPTT